MKTDLASLVAAQGAQVMFRVGTVVEVGEQVAVNVDGAQVPGLWMTGWIPKAGDPVLVMNDQQRTVFLGALAPAPMLSPAPSTVPPPVPNVAPTSGTTIVSAVLAGAWDSKTWSDPGDPVGQDTDLTSVWWFGQTLPGGLTVTSLKVRLPRRIDPGLSATVHLFFCTDQTRPVGAPSLAGPPTDATAGKWADPQWVTLPPAWGQALVESGGGIGIGGAPRVRFDGLDTDPTAGQLEITWTRPAPPVASHPYPLP